MVIHDYSWLFRVIRGFCRTETTVQDRKALPNSQYTFSCKIQHSGYWSFSTHRCRSGQPRSLSVTTRHVSTKTAHFEQFC